MSERRNSPTTPVSPAATLSRLEAASRRLCDLDDDTVIGGLSAALALWPGSSGILSRAVLEVAKSQGSSPDMIRFGLERLLESHREQELRRWLSQARVEAARRWAARDRQGAAPDLERLSGPPVVAQVLAGNLAGLGIPATLETLLARSAVVLKPAAGDPWTARLFKESLDRAAPILGEAVAVESWKGGAGGAEEEILNAVDFVIATGGEDMVASLSRRLTTPHRFHGPRFSLGVIGMEWMQAPDSWWEEVVRECVLWDQGGCLSPRVLFVAGSPRRFAGRLAPVMAGWQERWPARPWDAGTAAAVHAFRVPYEMAGSGTAGVLHPGDTSWTVVWDEDPTLDVGPPARVLRVTSRLGVPEFGDLLTAHRASIQGMGTAFLSPREAGWRRAAGWGAVPWIARLSEIQNPPAGWRADGRSGLSELLSWQLP